MCTHHLISHNVIILFGHAFDDVICCVPLNYALLRECPFFMIIFSISFRLASFKLTQKNSTVKGLTEPTLFVYIKKDEINVPIGLIERKGNHKENGQSNGCNGLKMMDQMLPKSIWFVFIFDRFETHWNMDLIFNWKSKTASGFLFISFYRPHSQKSKDRNTLRPNKCETRKKSESSVSAEDVTDTLFMHHSE